MIISKEELNYLYWTEGKSLQEIASQMRLSPTTVYRKMVKYGIPRRTISEAESGEKNPMFGKKHSESTKKKISEKRDGKCTISDDEKAKRSEAWRGKGNPRYVEHKIGEERVDKSGYVSIYVGKDYPNTNCGWIYKHIYVMEKKLGRKLTKEEVVHHIDRNKSNNEPENLRLFKNNSEHISHHNRLRATEKAER